MSHTKQKPSRRRLLHSLFIWHRYIGLSVALVVAMLTVTGLLLNHTEELGLDKKGVQSQPVLDWYGIKLIPPESSFSTGKQWISKIEDKLYLNDQPLSIKTQETLLGAISSDDFIMIAFPEQIVLMTEQGEIIEKIDSEQGLPGLITKIGRNNLNHIILKSPAGLFSSNDSLVTWQPSHAQNISWSQEELLPSAIKNRISQHFRQNIVPLERLLLDLHSGRLFGTAGVLFVDIASLLFLFLAFSGFLIWLRQRHHMQRRK